MTRSESFSFVVVEADLVLSGRPGGGCQMSAVCQPAGVLEVQTRPRLQHVRGMQEQAQKEEHIRGTVRTLRVEVDGKEDATGDKDAKEADAAPTEARALPGRERLRTVSSWVRLEDASALAPCIAG